MEKSYGTLFVSIPSLMDPSVAPPGHQIFRAFTVDWIDAWQVCETREGRDQGVKVWHCQGLPEDMAELSCRLTVKAVDEAVKDTTIGSQQGPQT